MIAMHSLVNRNKFTVYNWLADIILQTEIRFAFYVLPVSPRGILNDLHAP